MIDTMAAILEHRDRLQAQHERAITALAALVRQLERVGGYSSPQDQAELRHARAVIAEER